MVKVKIKDLGRVVTGKTPPSAHPEYFGGSTPFLTPTDMRYSRRVTTDRTISEAGVDRFHGSLLTPGSTAFVCIGATIGKVAQVSAPTLTNQQINSVIPNESMDPDYIYYALLFHKDRVVQVASGAATPIVNKTVFENLEINIHNSDEQKSIGTTLSAYDDLIENNSKRIENLEAIARLLYHRYLEGPEASGWGEASLSDLLIVHRGKSYKSSELSGTEGLPFVNLKCVNRGGGFRKDGLKLYTGSFKPTQRVEKGDVVMAVTDMTQERMIVARAARVPSLDGAYGVISMDMVKLEPKAEYSADYLYAMLRWSSFPDEVKNHANGANVLHLLPERISSYRVRIAPPGIRKDFVSNLKPILEMVDNLEQQNEHLRTIRDLLLPRLMSGKFGIAR